MCTHNICFHGDTRKISRLFDLVDTLSAAMVVVLSLLGKSQISGKNSIQRNVFIISSQILHCPFHNSCLLR